MKNIKISCLSIALILVASLNTACNKTTKIEREVEIGPNGSVSQQTTVDREITTEIKEGDVEVETKVNLD